MTYLTDTQTEQLLKPINPARVGKDGKGFSHVEAYDVKAHLIRVFGFARWSWEITDLTLVFESSEERTNKKTKEPYTAWTVAYRALGTLTVNAPDGTVLARYSEASTGDASNQPSRADAHDLALKTAESQAIKRCAINLGDQFGLSLYGGGSVKPLVRATLTTTKDGKDSPDAHVTQQLPPENQPPVESPIVSSSPPKTPPPPEDSPPDRGAAVQDSPVVIAGRIRDRAVELDRSSPTFQKDVRALMVEMGRTGTARVQVGDSNGEACTLNALLDNLMKRSRVSA